MHVCNLLWSKFVSALQPNSQGTIIPDERSDKKDIPLVLERNSLRQEENAASWRRMKVEGLQRLDNMRCLCAELEPSHRIALVFSLRKECKSRSEENRCGDSKNARR